MIDVLLATYNGERFLKEQLDSILNQTFQDFRILIRDDGSQDNTIGIIKQYEEKYPDKILFIEDNVICGNATCNFMQLCKYATSEYAMFCDQDDFWLPNKIDISYSEMRKAEKIRGSETPILVFGDYVIVDESLKLIPYKKNNKGVNLDLAHLLVQGVVPGCLAIFNKTLYSLMGNYSNSILMHDIWASLIASSFGVLIHIDCALMLYRQHENNVVGAIKSNKASYIIGKFKKRQMQEVMLQYKTQAELFLSRYKEKLAIKEYSIIKNFIDLFDEKNKIKRIVLLRKGAYLKSSLLKRLGQYLFV